MEFSINKARGLLCIIPLLWGGVASAQTSPFEETCALVAQHASDPNANCINLGSPELSYEYSFGNDSEGALAAIKSITKKFGNPDSIRGSNHVWRIKNPNQNLQQKKIITIVVTHNLNGESKIMMDRVRPGTVFATGKQNIKPRGRRSVTPDIMKSDSF